MLLHGIDLFKIILDILIMTYIWEKYKYRNMCFLKVLCYKHMPGSSFHNVYCIATVKKKHCL